MAESRTEQDEILEQLAVPAVFLETLTELNGEPTSLEAYQLRFLNDHSDFRIVNKSRQIGFSTIIAAEAVTTAITRRGYKANFVSINQTEAGDKIEIARNLYHSIPDAFADESMQLKPVLWKDAENEIAFHRPPNVSTLVSQPASSAVRGGRKDIYLDEFAHVRDAAKIYKAALPAITRGGGRMTIISTPLGQSGLFYDIASDPSGFPQYSRHAIPWWECSVFVKPGMLADAIAMAPELDTLTRVKTFATDKLLAILQSIDLLDFQTEYEASFVDEAEAYYTWDLVLRGVNDEFPIWRNLPEGWEAEGSVTIGVDLAKTRDESVFTVIEHIETDDEPDRAEVRMVKSSQEPYDDQLDYLLRLIEDSGAKRVSIDATGVGAMFYERAKAQVKNCSVEGIVFTNAKKEKWATKFKGDLQGIPKVRFPRQPDLMRQIHGIRRVKSDAGFFKFSGGAGAKRDDYFWSLMLGLYGEGRRAARISGV
jgi:phage FluMu gp28-like protein